MNRPTVLQQHNKSGETQKHVRYKHVSRICTCCIIALLLLMATLIQVRSMKTAQILGSIVVNRLQSISADERAIETQLSDLNYQTVTLAELKLLSVHMSNIHDDLILLHRYSAETGGSKEDARNQTNIVELYNDIYRYVSYSLPKAKEGVLGSEVVPISSSDIIKLEFIGDIHKILRSTHDEYGSSTQFTSIEEFFNDFYKKIDTHLEQQYNFKLSMSPSLEKLFE